MHIQSDDAIDIFQQFIDLLIVDLLQIDRFHDMQRKILDIVQLADEFIMGISPYGDQPDRRILVLDEMVTQIQEQRSKRHFNRLHAQNRPQRQNAQCDQTDHQKDERIGKQQSQRMRKEQVRSRGFADIHRAEQSAEDDIQGQIHQREDEVAVGIVKEIILIAGHQDRQIDDLIEQDHRDIQCKLAVFLVVETIDHLILTTSFLLVRAMI
jgi:hypothetical protein